MNRRQQNEFGKNFSVENGREVMLGKLYDLKVAVDVAEKNIEAKESN